jgi:hypothetical protein
MAVACRNSGFFEVAALPSKLLYLNGIIPFYPRLFSVRFGQHG